MNILDVMEGMANHFTGERHETILRWPWRLFCAKWVRLLEAGDRERRRRDKSKERQQDAEDMAQLYAVQRQAAAISG